MNKNEGIKTKFDCKKLISYGFFTEEDNRYILRQTIADGQLEIILTVCGEELTYYVTDPFDGSIYTLYLSENANGPFVSTVRYEIEKLIYDVESKCSLTERVDGEQKKLVTEYCLSKYGNSFEYLWDNSPDAAAIRRRDNRKWYGVLMKIASDKVGLLPSREIDVLNLHVDADKLQSLVTVYGIFPAYHMSKKHWVTVVLDGRVDTETIFTMIDESYFLGANKRITKTHVKDKNRKSKSEN